MKIRLKKPSYWDEVDRLLGSVVKQGIERQLFLGEHSTSPPLLHVFVMRFAEECEHTTIPWRLGPPDFRS